MKEIVLIFFGYYQFAKEPWPVVGPINYIKIHKFVEEHLDNLEYWIFTYLDTPGSPIFGVKKKKLLTNLCKQSAGLLVNIGVKT
jgi:hypothetical protein